MGHELENIEAMEHAEKILNRFIRKMRRDSGHVRSDTKKTEHAAEKHDYDKEIKFDGRIEDDVYDLLKHLIKALKAFVAVEANLVESENQEGPDAVKEHDKHKEEIEREISLLLKELRQIRSTEKRA